MEDKEKKESAMNAESFSFELEHMKPGMFDLIHSGKHHGFPDMGRIAEVAIFEDGTAVLNRTPTRTSLTIFDDFKEMYTVYVAPHPDTMRLVRRPEDPEDEIHAQTLCMSAAINFLAGVVRCKFPECGLRFGPEMDPWRLVKFVGEQLQKGRGERICTLSTDDLPKVKPELTEEDLVCHTWDNSKRHVLGTYKGIEVRTYNWRVLEGEEPADAFRCNIREGWMQVLVYQKHPEAGGESYELMRDEQGNPITQIRKFCGKIEILSPRRESIIELATEDYEEKKNGFGVFASKGKPVEVIMTTDATWDDPKKPEPETPEPETPESQPRFVRTDKWEWEKNRGHSILDRKTQLEWVFGNKWEGAGDQRYTWYELQTWYEEAEEDGWRIPTKDELKTLYDEEKKQMRLDGTGPEAIYIYIDSVFPLDWSTVWSQSLLIAQGERLQLVYDFSIGAGVSIPDSTTRIHQAMLVRDYVPLESNAARFSMKGRVITDHHTGFEWVCGSDVNHRWVDVEAWVSEPIMKDNGWRVPTAKELATLAEPGARFGTPGPTYLDPIFPITTGHLVWCAEKAEDLFPEVWGGDGETHVAFDFFCNKVRPMMADYSEIHTRMMLVRKAKKEESESGN